MEKLWKTVSIPLLFLVLCSSALWGADDAQFTVIPDATMAQVRGGQGQCPECWKLTNYCFLKPCNSTPCWTCYGSAFREYKCQQSGTAQDRCIEQVQPSNCGKYIKGSCILGMCYLNDDAVATNVDCPRTEIYVGNECP